MSDETNSMTNYRKKMAGKPTLKESISWMSEDEREITRFTTENEALRAALRRCVRYVPELYVEKWGIDKLIEERPHD